MPSSHTTSPSKRSVSSPQALFDQSTNPSQPPSPAIGHPQSNKPAPHKSHRTHVVGMNRGRNMSQKNLNKVQRLAFAHNLAAETDGQPVPQHLRHHQRKKSAPVSPSTSPRTGNQVRWNGSVVALGGPSIRKNYSTPTLRRDGAGLVRKGKLLGNNDKNGQPEPEPEPIKSVGFELAGSDEDDEWEDHSSQSPGSTRRNSLASAKANGDLNNSLNFTKSPLAQESTVTDMKGQDSRKPGLLQAPSMQEQTHVSREDTTPRLLPRPHSSKAPPAISSVSATSTPAPTDRSSRVSSFANISGAHQSQTPATSKVDTPKASPHATSSSTEAGISRFLINHPNATHGGTRSESDFSTPSSFLPHYRPTPPSPESLLAKPAKSPTSSRRRTAEPHSRTQQKLWLQRTATLSTSPSESAIGGLTPVMPPTAADPNLFTSTHSRSSSGLYGHDGYRLAIAPSGLSGGPTTESEAKRVRKIYERFTSEFSVMHRFRNPIADSLNRIHEISKPLPTGEPAIRNSASTSNLNQRDNISRQSQSRDPSLIRNSEFQDARVLARHAKRHSQVRFHDQGDLVNIVHSGQPGGRPDADYRHNSRPTSASAILPDSSTLDDNPDGTNGDVSLSEANMQANKAPREAYQPSEEDLLIRRMWNSREVAVVGD